MKEILLKLTELVEEVQVAKKVYNEKTEKARCMIVDNEAIAHRLKEEGGKLKEDVAKTANITNIAAIRENNAKESKRIIAEQLVLDEYKEKVDIDTQKSLAEVKSKKEDLDLQQKSLNDQKVQLATDRANYKDEVLKEVAKEN